MKYCCNIVDKVTEKEFVSFQEAWSFQMALITFGFTILGGQRRELICSFNCESIIEDQGKWILKLPIEKVILFYIINI